MPQSLLEDRMSYRVRSSSSCPAWMKKAFLQRSMAASGIITRERGEVLRSDTRVLRGAKGEQGITQSQAVQPRHVGRAQVLWDMIRLRAIFGVSNISSQLAPKCAET